MKANIGEEQKIYSQKIYNLRQSGRINEAITVCNEAIKKLVIPIFIIKFMEIYYLKIRNLIKL